MAKRVSRRRRAVARPSAARRPVARRAYRSAPRRGRATSVRRGSGVLKIVIESASPNSVAADALASAQGVQAIGTTTAKRSKF